MRTDEMLKRSGKFVADAEIAALKAEKERLRAALEDTAYPLGEIDGLTAQIERLRTALKIARVMVLDEPLAHALYSNGRTLIQVLNLALGPEQRDGGK
jgi:hypothetical protein